MKNNISSKFKIGILVLFTTLMIGCNNEPKKIEIQKNNPDITLNLQYQEENKFRLNDGKYFIYSHNNSIIGEMIKDNKAMDASENITDLPDAEIGEYEQLEIKFINDKFVNIIRKSYTVNEDYKVLENLVTRCEITNGSEAIFNNGGNITLKSLNTEELDSIQTVILKAVLYKKLNIIPQKSTFEYKSTSFEAICNSKEILCKTKGFFKASCFLYFNF